jgi:hypothetical protein
MRLLGVLLGIPLLLTGSGAAAEVISLESRENTPLRLSPSLGGGFLSPNRPDGVSMESGVFLAADLTVEAGPIFFGAGALLQADNVFVGGKLGYTLGGSTVAVFASAGAGYLWQHAVLPFDEGTSASSSGLAFELEAGAILFRRPGYGRIWIFGFALLPTFSVGMNPSVITPPTESIPSLGFGLRLAL